MRILDWILDRPGIIVCLYLGFIALMYALAKANA